MQTRDISIYDTHRRVHATYFVERPGANRQKIECFHEDIVGEHSDCHQAYIAKVSVYSGHSTNGIRRSRASSRMWTE